MLTNLLALTAPCNPNSATWMDTGTVTCAQYELFGFCLRDGKANPLYWGVELSHNPFGDIGKTGGPWETRGIDGFHAGNCPECGCTPQGNHVIIIN